MTAPIIFAQRRRDDPVKVAARLYREAGARPQQAIVRATVDDMRASMGMPPAEWPEPLEWWQQ